MSKVCIQGNVVEVLSSGAGFYIGTFDPQEGPVCRISQNYYKTREKAQDALDNNTYFLRDCEENIFCNGGKGCCIFEDTMSDLAETIANSPDIPDRQDPNMCCGICSECVDPKRCPGYEDPFEEL